MTEVTHLHEAGLSTDTWVSMEDPGPRYVPELEPSQLEALVEAMYLVAFADGVLSDDERAHFGRSVRTLTDGRLSGSAFDHVIASIEGELTSKGHERCVESLARRLPGVQLREVALILAADMAAADGVICDDERALLERMAAAFEMDDGLVEEAIEGLTRAHDRQAMRALV